MIDLTKLSPEELQKQFLDRIMVSVRNPEWREISRRVERLEHCERLCEYAQHYPSCDSLDSAIGHAIPCNCGYDAARAALEGKCSTGG